MKTKLKLLFLALLGLILIPTTNAYELGANLNWTNANYDVEYKDAKFTLYNSSYPYIVAYPCSNSSQGSKCFSAPYYSSVIFDYSYSIHVSLDSYSFNKFFGVAYKDNWEWRDFYHSVYSSENKAVQKVFNVPSRTAFSVKMTNGKEYIMDTVYFYHNTLVFMDSRNWFTLYLNGNIKASDGVVFVDPFLKEDNFFFIRFSEKKAWSMTVSEEEAWNWFFWKKNWELLKTLKFTKSYEVREGGETIFPINFHVWKDKQGWPWYTYQEDIEFVSPEWNAGNPNNNWTWNQVAQNYRACVSKRSDIKILAQISKTCGDDPADEETLNWVKVDSWNWEWEVKTIIDQLTGKNKTKCGRYANTKKKYHDKYSKEWESFSKDFNNYAFTPEALDVQAQCRWEELEQEHWSANNKVEWGFFQGIKNWFEWMRDKFRGYSWEPIGVYSGKNYYELDFNSDLAQLKIYQERCKSFWSLLGYVVWFDTVENERKRYCDKFEKKKKEMETIYWSFSWYNGLSGTYYSLSGNFDDLGRWNNFVKVITDPFYSWYNAYDLLPPLCSVKSDGVFDIVFYVFFACVVFYVFRLFV